MSRRRRAGTIDGCHWSYSRGTLTIGPKKGTSGELSTGPRCYLPWIEWVDDITQVVVLPGTKAKGVLRGAFSGMSSLRTANLKGLDTSGASDLSALFQGCPSLKRVNGLASLDVSRVRNLTRAFEGCSSLTSLGGAKKWRPTSLKHASCMLSGTTIDPTFVLSWNALDASDFCELMADPTDDVLCPSDHFHDVITRWLALRERELDRRRGLVADLVWLECDADEVGPSESPIPDATGVYVIENKDRGHIYVGQSSDLAKRVRSHLIRSSCQDLRADIEDGDRIAIRYSLLEGSGYNDPLALEADVISLMHAVRDGYNQRPGDIARHDISDEGLAAAALERDVWSHVRRHGYSMWHAMSGHIGEIVTNGPSGPVFGHDVQSSNPICDDGDNSPTLGLVGINIVHGHHKATFENLSSTTYAQPFLIVEELAARVLNVTEADLATWRDNGLGPGYVCMHDVGVRYRVDVLEAWLDSHGPGVPSGMPVADGSPAADTQAEDVRPTKPEDASMTRPDKPESQPVRGHSDKRRGNGRKGVNKWRSGDVNLSYSKKSGTLRMTPVDGDHGSIDIKGDEHLFDLLHESDDKPLRAIKAKGTITVVGKLNGLFAGQRYLEDISGLSAWDVSSVTSLARCFKGCFRLADLSPLIGWDVSHVTDVGHCFEGCDGLRFIDLSTWELTSCTNTASFLWSTNLEEVPLSGDIPFNTLLKMERSTRNAATGRCSPTIRWIDGWGRHVVVWWDHGHCIAPVPIHDAASGEWILAPIPSDVVHRAPRNLPIGTTMLERHDDGRVWRVGEVDAMSLMPRDNLWLEGGIELRFEEPLDNWSDTDVETLLAGPALCRRGLSSL